MLTDFSATHVACAAVRASGDRSYNARYLPVQIHHGAVEPHGKPWLFAIDLPGTLPAGQPS